MKKIQLAFVLAIVCTGLQASAQETGKYLTSEPPENKTMKPEETEYYTPVPPTVTPGNASGEAPSDAIVLFDGKSLQNWVSAQDTTKAAQWTVENGALTVKPGAGNIQTRQRFGDYQLHLEWRTPSEPDHKGQDRGNSGLFLASVGPGDDGYELQVLDSYHAPTYVDGQAGSLYKQFPPLVNACRPPGQWQTYDVIWTAPRFNADGSVASPATVTAFQNGVLIQNHSVLKGRTVFIGHPYYTDYGPAPIKLQDHHHLVSYRNIWIRPLK
ncbi:DUF1080 domain-containing protein [Compostibacter hankyongensis]|uniref:DUF1080 domain-containing protein n=1 Tax=Compostibacter hankyongensis TaxID=1007089 RepID=A0ABP8FHF6_9BACT